MASTSYGPSPSGYELVPMSDEKTDTQQRTDNESVKETSLRFPQKPQQTDEDKRTSEVMEIRYADESDPDDDDLTDKIERTQEEKDKRQDDTLSEDQKVDQSDAQKTRAMDKSERTPEEKEKRYGDESDSDEEDPLIKIKADNIERTLEEKEMSFYRYGDESDSDEEDLLIKIKTESQPENLEMRSLKTHSEDQKQTTKQTRQIGRRGIRMREAMASTSYGRVETLSEDRKVAQSTVQKTRRFVRRGKRMVEAMPFTCYGRVETLSEDPNIAQSAAQKTIQEGQKKWIQENIKLRRYGDEEASIPCDAFGEVKLNKYGQETAKFVRVDHQTSMEAMIHLITRLWKLSLPKLLISVTGGRNYFRWNPLTKETLGVGLVRAARSTDAWIISEGLHSGVSKCIGEAIHDNEGISADGNKVVKIGIAPWNCVQNKKSLVNKEGSWPAEYYVNDDDYDLSTYRLNPNHSHFILVDNDTPQDTSGVAIEFRRMFEDTILKEKIRGSNQKIPSVVVMVGGEIETLISVCDSISRNIPVIIVKESGGAADIMAYAYQTVYGIVEDEDKNKTDGSIQENTRDDIREKITEEFGMNSKRNNDEISNLVDCVMKSIKRPNLLTLCNMYSAEDFGVSIMNAVFNAKDNNLEIMRLGFEWKNSDTVRREIFTERAHLQEVEMKRIQERITLRNAGDEEAFGEIKFKGYDQETATFVRVDHKTPMENMICFIIYLWDLSLPNLLISVIGERENDRLNPFNIEALGSGLFKVARTTDAWIISEGLHRGVSRYIGKAIHDKESKGTDKNKVVTIGIAPWNCVKNKESLVNEKGSWPADYNVTDDANTGIYSLDPNYSHFILVDNGTQETSGVETEFRKRLEDTILQEKVRGTESKIPSVAIMVGGGPETLKSVIDSISRNIPVIILKGSGGAADIMASAYQTVIENEDEKDKNKTDGSIQENTRDDIREIKTTIAKIFEKNLETDEINNLVDCVLRSLKQSNLLTLYDIDSAEDFDISIMKAVFKANEKLRGFKRTSKGKRIVIALNKIFTETTSWPRGRIKRYPESRREDVQFDFAEDFWLTSEIKEWMHENIKLRNAGDEKASIPCDAFGEVQFMGYGQETAKFVRVNHDTSKRTMMHLIRVLWNLTLPRLLISVTGRRKNFRLSSITKEALGRDLVKAARITDAWIISEGLQTDIGEAIHDNEGISADGNKVVTIGIAPWNCVQNNESLVNKEGSWPAKYYVNDDDGDSRTYALDPNHSHFILVDNGTQDTSGVEIEFRRMFENTIAEMNIPGTTFKIPSVVVMVGGGFGTLMSVCDSISRNIPVIIVKGSGGAAGIMAYAYQALYRILEDEDITDGSIYRKLKNAIKDKITKKFEKYFAKDDMNYLADFLLDSMRQLKLITVFEENSAEDFGLVIMKAVFKAKNIFKNSKPTAKWKRIEIALNKIFTEGTQEPAFRRNFRLEKRYAEKYDPKEYDSDEYDSDEYDSDEYDSDEYDSDDDFLEYHMNRRLQKSDADGSLSYDDFLELCWNYRLKDRDDFSFEAFLKNYTREDSFMKTILYGHSRSEDEENSQESREKSEMDHMFTEIFKEHIFNGHSGYTFGYKKDVRYRIENSKYFNISRTIIYCIASYPIAICTSRDVYNSSEKQSVVKVSKICRNDRPEERRIVTQDYLKEWIQEDIKLRNAGDEEASIPCDAFGEVKFKGYGQERAKFVRMDHKTSMGRMMYLIKVLWNLSLPNLFISLTGGRDFQLTPPFEETFAHSLVKAAKTAGAWIISEGLHTGVSKCIGEAIHDNEGKCTDKNKLVTIGIAPWNCVQNKKSLVNKMGSWPATYDIKDDDSGIYALDPNHSHFILVDNGTQDTSGVEIEFRKMFENTIAEIIIPKTDYKILSVVVMVGGGPGTLKSVCDSISHNIPVVIAEGSGGAADIMAHAYQRAYVILEYEDGHLFKQLNNWRVKDDIREKITKEFEMNLEQNEINNMADCVLTSLKQPNLLTLYNIDSAEDFDVSIMKAVFKAKNKSKHVKRMGKWKRIDDALNKIFTDGTHWQIHQLDNFMLSALLNDRVDLMKPFQEHGVSLTEFITDRHINILYIMKNGNVISNLNCGEFLDEFLPKIHLKKADLSFATQLFLWALFLDRKEMAFLFWKEGMGALPSALVANRLLRSMKEKCKEYGRSKQLEEYAKIYEKHATGLLTECYHADDKKTLDLLMLKQKTWDNASYMQIASNFENKKFKSEEACQSVLTKIWMGKMSSKKNNILKLLLCTLCPLFIFLIEFDDEKKTKQNKDDGSQRNTKESCYKSVEKYCNPRENCNKLWGKCRNPRENCNKLWGKCRNMFSRCLSFYTTPVIKFLTNLIFFVIFLCIYSYVLLVELKPQISYLEGILFVWVISIITEEIHQFFNKEVMLTQRSTSLREQLISYIKNVWNVIDVITIIMFFIGYILRFLKLDDAARVMLCLNLISFYIRFLHMLSFHEHIGPKLVMIRKMLHDFLHFIMVMFVFMTAYGIATQSILYPSTPVSFELFKGVFKKAYFHMYGELFLEEYEGDTDCNVNNSTCPSEVGTYVAPILMSIYISLTNILLLNLLIAMFSYTFQDVQKNDKSHWSLQRYNLIFEFCIRPSWPPPVILLSNIYQFCCYLYRKARLQDPIRKHIFSKTFNRNERKELLDWEHKMLQSYVSTQNKPDNIKILTLKVEELQQQLKNSRYENSQNIEEKVSELSSRTDQLTSKVEESQHNVEEKMKNIDTTLAWMKENLMKTHL